MKKLFIGVIAFLFTFLFSFSASAQQWLHHSASNLKFSAPENWSAVLEEETLTLSPPSEGLAITFTVLDAENLEVALEELEKELSNYVKDAKLKGEAEEIIINDLNAISAEGEGKIDGEKVDLGLLLVEANDKILLVFGISAVSETNKYEKDIENILTSIQKR